MVLKVPSEDNNMMYCDHRNSSSPISDQQMKINKYYSQIATSCKITPQQIEDQMLITDDHAHPMERSQFEAQIKGLPTVEY